MFVLNKDDLSIYATRGDIVFFSVTAEDEGKEYTFKAGDMVRIKVFGKKNAENVVLQKDFPVLSECTEVEIYLDKEDTKIGDVISKPKDYWYEIELNPYNNPQTLIGYDEDGAKVFKLFPEGADIPAFVPTPEDIPFIDDELDLTSPRPVENQAVARAVTRLKGEIEKTNDAVNKKTASLSQSISGAESEIAVERARIDNLATGATADAAEVVDIRVGANGITYNSAGTAVREQLAAIKRSLANNYIRLESKNLVNKDKLTYGSYVDYWNGELVEHADSAYTELIEIKADTNYTYSMHATNRAVGQLAYYDAAEKFISGVPNSGVKDYITLASPKNAKYVRWTVPVGYVDMVSIVEGAVVVPYEDYYPCIPDKYLEKFVEVGEGKEFTSILRALKKTADDTAIYVHPGVYNIVHEYKDFYGEDYFDIYSGYADVSDKFSRGLWLGKGRKVIGISNVKLVFDYAGDNSNVHDFFSVIANDSDTLLENVTIKVYENCRYHIHDDFQPQNGSVTFRNLVLDGKPFTPVFIGGGVGKNVTYLIDRCVFLGDEKATYDISYHGNTRPDTDVECKIDVVNCYGSSGCAFRWYGASDKVTLCTVSDSKFSKIECIPYDENQTNENMKLIAWSYKGEKGDTGEQGIQGVKGDKGETGAKGEKGDPGDAYDAPPIVFDASGEVIEINDSAERPLHGLKLYGKTIQNGTPTPDSPVELESVGADGNIGVIVCGKNLMRWPLHEPNSTRNGVTYKGNDDGSVSVSGDASTAGSWWVANYEEYLPKGTYTFSGIFDGFADTSQIYAYVTDRAATKTLAIVKPTKKETTFIVTEDLPAVGISVAIPHAETVAGKVWLQLERGSVATEYEQPKMTQRAAITNGLPGIPVSSGGNYTDENGQMWVCDEVDFARGVHVQRVLKLSLPVSEMNNTDDYPGWKDVSAVTEHLVEGNYNLTASKPVLSNISNPEMAKPFGINNVDGKGIIFLYTETWGKTQTQWKEQYPNLTVEILVPMDAPIETDLTAEEIAQYSALYTNYPNTTIYNDEGAGMGVKYVVDTKMYIDKKFAELASALLNA